MVKWVAGEGGRRDRGRRAILTMLSGAAYKLRLLLWGAGPRRASGVEQ